MDDFEKFKETFITESFELLGDMEELLLNLQEGSSDVEALNAIFRCAHSIKGGAGAFGFSNITEFTHILETLLDKLREGKIEVSSSIVDTLLKSRDIVEQMVSAAKLDEKLEDNFGSEVRCELEQFCENSGVNLTIAKKPINNVIEEDELKILRITFKPNSNIFYTGNEPILIIKELASLGEFECEVNFEEVPCISKFKSDECYLEWVFDLETEKSIEAVKEVFEFIEDDCSLKIEKIAGFALQTNDTTEKKEISDKKEAKLKEQKEEPTSLNKTAVSSIRVDIDKVDRLVNMVGELVITQSMLFAQTSNLPIDQYAELIRGVEELSQHTRELQEAVMAVRMQPVKSVFSRMPRIVRDITNQLSKQIKLVMVGENTEVDKTVIEQLGDPLTHMIRNACDHGVETPEERTNKNKNPEGTITLSASNHGGKILIEIEDDGKGLDPEKIYKKALEKNIITEGTKLSDHEMVNLVFMPGFSTAQEISNISGRGVGMDVVKRNIESLGGTVEIFSEVDKGSTFTVMLPLTLAILDGMIVRVGDENYIIPIANIIETLRPQQGGIKSVSNGHDVLNVRGEYVSVLYLSSLFDVQNAERDPQKALIVLVENGSNKFGIFVDELVGQQQVVIKSLEENSDPVNGISGATILGDGKVSLILDIGKLNTINNELKFTDDNKLKAIGE